MGHSEMHGGLFVLGFRDILLFQIARLCKWLKQLQNSLLSTQKSRVVNLSDILASPYEDRQHEIIWYGLSPSDEIIISSIPNENKIKSRYKMSSSITSLNLVAANSSTLKYAPSSFILLAILVVLSYLWSL